ncbi:hypothetical protein EV193_107285 [Herbihabitans rhizosphaerae]|uniref:Knr4/Smi1-like domain-containing protein n=1 Tax=Herbihabitans rhizosphaerae TaxID=1872711 RepID=A0A4Q7KK66_9PSEU|nr:SMI1/KNR4 family protein [Herbihabitans rhizosphaerae]RZS36604.1 hypothetical protein EV193_107285 [Herbihabitans rhizosphaerae]
MTSWPDLIADMIRLRKRVAELEEYYPVTVPHPPATEAQIAEAESRLGHALDPQHRELLLLGNGWPDFWFDSVLLSTDQLGASPEWDAIDEGFDAFYSSLPDKPAVNFVPPREELYPITFDPGSSSVFAIWIKGPVTDGGHPVIWMPWQDSEPLANLVEFFRDTAGDYERELAELIEEKSEE